MKMSEYFFKTYRENPQDAEIISHKLLVRAGYIKKQSAGSYIILPLGLKVLQTITNVVREEMNKAGACEVVMPMLLQEEVYEHRINKFGPTMFRLRDRNGKGLCLGPTHEEVFTELVKDTVNSYKNLPLNLYQIGTKFRDEIRPRFGLQRTREFIMKDAYSYDKDLQGLEKSFDIMKQTYINIFNRLGLEFVIVDADNGSMGGFGSNEFMVKSNVGEDEIAVCDKCGYAANIEKATYYFEELENNESELNKQKVYTPNFKTIEEVANFLNVPTSKLVKSVAYSYDNGIAIVYLRGDREVEEVKLANYLNTTKLEFATSEEIKNFGSVAGFIGPNANFKNVTIIVDREIKNMKNFVMGANETDYHYINCNLTDIVNATYIDVRKVAENDICPICKGKISLIRGIEVGHIFKLGTHYTKLLNCTYLDENGKEQLMYMGCYGIGISRILSALVEQNNDEQGIVWRYDLAPFKAGIFAANFKDEQQVSNALKLYEELKNKNIDVLLDDRKETYGVKIKDMQLIGLPYAIIAGKGISEGKFEVVNRLTKEVKMLTIDEVLQLF